MRAFVNGMWQITLLELRQRLRSIAWYVLFGFFVVCLFFITYMFSQSNASDNLNNFFSTIVYFVLLLASLVSPALSGNAINGDRETGTLATTQVTLITTSQLVFGKFLAAWITALTFLAASIPFLIYAFLSLDVPAQTVMVSLLIVSIELGVIAAIGVGFSALTSKSLFSVAGTYLVVAFLSIGTLIVFGLVAETQQTKVTLYERVAKDLTSQETIDATCGPYQKTESYRHRTDRAWWVLSANPYVILGDAVPSQFDAQGHPVGMFSFIASEVRKAQIPPLPVIRYDGCRLFSQDSETSDDRTAEEIYNSTIPSWFVGLLIHVLIAGFMLFVAVRRTHTPRTKIPMGSRIA